MIVTVTCNLSWSDANKNFANQSQKSFKRMIKELTGCDNVEILEWSVEDVGKEKQHDNDN